jgi:C4-dicarboxylate-specific signal transduction histidine kinase
MDSSTFNGIKASLKERIKELECLYEILQISVDKQNHSLEEIFQEIVNVLPPAWQYPEITSAKIILDGKTYFSKQYCSPVHKQEAEIITNGIFRGEIEISYSEDAPDSDEGPFLKEERALINSISKKCALILMRIDEKKKKDILESKLIHADRLATVGELTAGIAHELNEPLGSILGFAQLIQKENELSEQGLSDLNKILNASLHAREIIRKLMTFSRYEEKTSQKINLDKIIQDGIYLLEARCAKEGIEVIISGEKYLPTIYANPVQINQVVVNISINAIQAMPNGGKLFIHTFADNDNVHLIIQDTGTGISEDHLPKIFDPFFTTKESKTNTGLGLSVVHGIVSSYHGKIEIESNLGIGTRFDISFPIYR